MDQDDLVIIGDRVLVSPDEENNRTDTGLYLPQGAKEKEEVQSGYIIKVGPGYPIPDPTGSDMEPWKNAQLEKKYFPLQAKEGDYCIFLRKHGVEISYEGKKYIVVPHSAILVLLKGKDKSQEE